MKVALIPPAHYVAHYGMVTNYHMALAHLVLKDPAYAQHYRNASACGHMVILDNSIIELGQAVTMDELVKAAKAIDAKVIIAPDVLDDRKGTYERVQEAVSYMWSNSLFGDFQLMAVPQGNDLQEFIASYQELAELEEVEWMSIPKRVGRFIEDPQGLNRVRVLDTMSKLGIIDEEKQHHLLGIYDNPLEILYLNQYPWITGIDSQLPFWAANEGVIFNPVFGMQEQRGGKNIPLDDPTIVLDDATLNHNILCMLGWSNWCL